MAGRGNSLIFYVYNNEGTGEDHENSQPRYKFEAFSMQSRSAIYSTNNGWLWCLLMEQYGTCIFSPFQSGPLSVLSTSLLTFIYNLCYLYIETEWIDSSLSLLH
jgi:hypothetical protein